MAVKNSDYWKKLYNSVLKNTVSYAPSAASKKAYSDWKNTYSGGFKSSYDSLMNALVKQIDSRKAFDINDSEYYNRAYNIYKNQYESLGKQAMENTMADASSLTGGYSNSYASTAANTAYQSYMDKLNSVIPTLYSQAYDIYKEEGDALYDKLASYEKLRDSQRDSWNDYVDNLYNNYKLSSDRDYKAYKSAADNRKNLLNAIYNNYKTALAKEQFERNMAYKYASLNSRKSSSKSNKNQQVKIDGIPSTQLDKIIRDAYTKIKTGRGFTGFGSNYTNNQRRYLSKGLNTLMRGV